MVSIPEGDWFCFDCVSKATGKCHCFVCGLAKHIKASGTPDNTPTAFVDPSHRLVKCATCSRGAHMSCLRPPMTRPTRRWNCMLCIVNGASMSAEKVASSDVAASSPATKSTRCQQVSVQCCPSSGASHLLGCGLLPQFAIYLRYGEGCGRKRVKVSLDTRVNFDDHCVIALELVKIMWLVH